MPTLAQGSSDDLTLSAFDSITVTTRGSASVQMPVGTSVGVFTGTRTFGPFGAGTARVTATAGDLVYEVADGDNSAAPLTEPEVSAVRSLVSGDWIAPVEKLRVNGSAGSFGSLIHGWTGTRSDSGGTVTRIQYNRTSTSGVTALSPYTAAPNVIRFVGNGGSSQQNWTEQFTGIDCTTVRNVGVWTRAMPRSDGRRYTIARLILAQDNAGAPNFGATFAIWTYAVPADGKWRFCVLSVSSTVGIGASTLFIPGTGQTIAHVRAVCITTADVGSRSAALPNGDVLEYGAITLNPRGAKSAAIFRIDDQYAATQSAFGSLWDSAFASGFTSALSRSGVTISLAEGRAMSMVDLIERFGFRASWFILVRQLGLRGYMTAAQLRALEARGHVVCFQSVANPTSGTQLGATLLGPAGFAIGPAGSIAAIAGTSLTWTANPVTSTTTNVTAPQGFPVTFDAAGIPPTIQAGATYWLRRVDANTISVHPSETDAADNINAISFVGATAGSLVMRYAGATNDATAINAEFANGAAWMVANGFTRGAKIYAPNQGAMNEAVEDALLSAGFQSVFASTAPSDVFALPFASAPYSYITANQFTTGAGYLMVRTHISTDGASTEAQIREYVRQHVQEGSIIQNVQHAVTAAIIQNAVWYLDELKYWADSGMVYVDTAEKVAEAVRAVRIGG